LTIMSVGWVRHVAADQGVSINLGRVDVDERLSPGGRYRLPTLVVTNTGDETSAFEVTTSYQAGVNASRPPESWFEIDPPRFSLEPGGEQAVSLHIGLPATARPEHYAVLIEAHIVASTTETRVSAAAATRISFTVKPASLWSAWLLRAQRAFRDTMPWSYVMPAITMSVVTLYFVRRHVSIRLSVRRRP